MMSICVKKRHIISKEINTDYLIKLNYVACKPVSVYCAKTGDLIITYKSVKDLWKNYNHAVSYRTIRRYLKSGLPLYKLNIIIKYDS